MDTLALSDEILMSVEKPARYIGNEYNMVVKDPEQVEIRYAFCFPDVYEIGMSHLGMQILYDMLNQREDTYCERVYSPWPDLDRILRDKKIPLFTLETQSPVRGFDILGITIQYEMCYTNILQVLDLSQIPIFAKDRTKEHPIVIGGGPCAYNPEPIADFFDLFYIGEGEVSYPPLLELYKTYKKSSMSKQEFLLKAAQIEGIYVPSLYEVTYNADGTIETIQPKYENVPAKVKKVIVTDFNAAPYPMKPLVPMLRATQDRVVLEIMRGCIRGCRFCQAGMVYRPTRQKDCETMKKYAETMLRNTGYEDISLSSLSSSDYEYLEELIKFLIEQMEENHVNISLPSLRIDAFSLDVMRKVQDVRKVSLTFAPEAGTQRLRDVINKGLTEEMIVNGAREAFQGGWNKVKLYFMLGLPTETDEDAEGIALLSERISEEYFATVPKEERVGSVQITASAAYFVPKPFTPFQWAPMLDREAYVNRAYHVKDTFNRMLNKKRLKFTYHDQDISILEGVFARGDRKLCGVIYDAYMDGAIFDAWTEFFDMSRYERAFEKNNMDYKFYTERERSVDEILPWDHIDAGISKDFLIREWENAQKGIVSQNCRSFCQGCGAASFGGGVCFESKN